MSTYFVFKTVRRRLRCVLQNVQVHTATLVATVLNCPSGYSRVSVKNSVSGCPAAPSMSRAMLVHRLSRSITCPRCLGCLIPHFQLSCRALVFELAGVLSSSGLFGFPNPCPQGPVEKFGGQIILATKFFRPVALRDSLAWTGPACVGYSTGGCQVGLGRV